MIETTDTAADGARHVLSLRNSGIGDCLVCLGAAWVYARATGRVLVADWRRSPYAPDRATNLFPLCFAAPDHLAGVPFVGDQRVDRLIRRLARGPVHWDRAPAALRTQAQVFADRDRSVALIRSGVDRPEPTVVFDACVNDGLVALEDARAFLGALQPVDRIARRLERVVADLPPGPVIGLHARHGNGGAIGQHTPFWSDEAAAIERCRRGVAALRARLGERTPVLVCTDSVAVARAVSAAVPGIIRYAKPFRAPGSGELHGWSGAHRTLDDALVEMLALTRMTAVIRYPPGSFFSMPAAVALARPGPRTRTLYDLQRPWTPDDPLAPAIVPDPGEL